MTIEWFRDLSIAVLGFVTTVVLIFTAVLVYRLYRELKSILLLMKEASKLIHDTITLVHEGPLTTILALIHGVREGFKNMTKLFKKGEGTEEKQNGN